MRKGDFGVHLGLATKQPMTLGKSLRYFYLKKGNQYGTYVYVPD